MRLLFISPGFAAYEQDHNCIPPLQMLAAEMTRQGIDIQIITLGYPFHNQAYLWHNIPVISGYGFNGKHLRWLNWFRVIRYALAIHRKHPFDAIHSFWLGPAWLIGNYLAARWRVPHYCTLMGQDVLPANVYRRLLSPAQAPNLIALSAYQQQVFYNTSGIQTGHVIPFGIDPQEIPAPTPWAERPIDILGCGSFIPVKNWPRWLYTVARCAQNNPHLKTVLIGDGPERSRLEELAAQLGISNLVTFTGHIPRAQVLAHMQQAKVFLHTADFESLGFVLAEANMCGCRVLSTPVGMAAELAHCGATEEELAELVVAALEKEERGLGKSMFTMGEAVGRYRAVYGG